MTLSTSYSMLIKVGIFHAFLRFQPILFESAADGKSMRTDFQVIGTVGGNVLQIDNVRAVKSQKAMVRQHLFECCNAELGDRLLIVRNDPDIVLEALEVKDLVEKEFDHLAIDAEIQEGPFAEHRSSLGLTGKGQMAIGLLQAEQETFERDGFQEIVRHIQFEPFESEVPVGRGQNHLGPLVERPQKLQSVQLRHLDIQEEQVDGLLPQKFVGIQCVGALPCAVQQVEPGNMAPQNSPGMLLVIDDQTIVPLLVVLPRLHGQKVV